MLSLLRLPMTKRQKPRHRRNHLQSLVSVWSALDAGRRAFVIIATVAVFAAVLLLARGSGARDMALLFGGLEPATAGEVITSLDQSGAIYEVRGNAIYVAANMRDSLRMSLAGQGLPASGAQGYELLDSLSGFGTTSQMFDAAYWRAKEGELARTIMASGNIKSARVHISTPSTRGFARDQIATAAVNVTTTSGTLAQRHVKALQYLVAAAVQGLRPEDVAVVDGASGLLSGRDDVINASSGDERAQALRQRAERLLAARVGAGNAVVEVTVESVTEAEQITERRFDPESRVAISTDLTETVNKSQDSGAGGDVTVASNLPGGDAAGGGGGTSSSENSESRTLTNFEVNETQRQLTRVPGDVRRLTVAVLINDTQRIGENGEVEVEKRDPAELEALEALVAAAVGLNPERGDTLTLRSMPFEPITEVGTSGIIGATTPLNIMRLIQIGVLAVVALILGLFVVRPILAPNPQRVLALANARNATPDALDGDVTQLPNMTQNPAQLPSPNGDDATATPASDPVTRLREIIQERETETIQVLQDWIEEPSPQGEQV